MATAIVWARERGHAEVVRLIEASRRALGPPLLTLPSHAPGGYSSAVKLGTLTRFIVRGDNSFGFIQPDEEDGEDVFVHIETLRGATRGKRGGYPSPGQRLAYMASQGRKGPRANRVADGEDGGALELPLNDFDAEDEWRRAEYDDEDGFYGF